MSNFITKIVAIIFVDYDKFFNKLNKKFMNKKKFLTKFFDVFKNQIDCFDHKKINKLSFHRKKNHKIRLIFEITLSTKKTYDLFKNQTTIVKIYVNEMFDKSYIKFNFFDYAAFVLIMKKFEKKLKMCIDYRALNALTIKNKNNSSFIKKTLVRLCVVKYYIKLNVIIAFNKIRIIENDEKKTIFFIKYELYEYVIMFFDVRAFGPLRPSRPNWDLAGPIGT